MDIVLQIVSSLLLLLPVLLLLLLIFKKLTGSLFFNSDIAVDKDNFSTIPKTHKQEKILQLKESFQTLNIEEYFSELHHFNSEVFINSPPTLNKHINDCFDNNFQDENMQTLERAFEFSKLISLGLNPEKSLAQSWVKFPVLKSDMEMR